MIKYFILDLDGCISYPFKSPDWEAITKIRELQMRSEREAQIPALSLCTGRPLPYAEAVAQWLGIRHTIIFESGGGFYHPVSNELTWSPYFTKDIERKSVEIRKWLTLEIHPMFPDTMLEFSKHTDVGVMHTDFNEIKKVYEIAKLKINEEFPEFEVHHTEVSVNIIVSMCNKASGLQYFADRHGVTAEEIAYIGDSSGDVMALQWAGMSYAPANAIDVVRSQSRVMESEATQGVLEAYREIIVRNAPDSPETLP